MGEVHAMARALLDETPDVVQGPDPATPTPHELHAFLGVAETLHFGRAARSMGLAQSSLSECIRRLEGKLGVVLFERTSRRVGLTDAGARLVPWARRILEGLGAAHAAVDVPRDHTVETLRVGVEGFGFESVLNHGLVERFRERFPRTRLTIYEMHGTPAGFMESGADVAFVRSPMADRRIRVETLRREKRAVLVARHHPLAEAERPSLDEVFRETFVAVAPQDAPTCDYWMGADVDGGPERAVAGEANSTMEVLYAVSYLGLLTTGTAAAVDPGTAGGVRFLTDLDLPPVRVGVAARADERRRSVLEFMEITGDLAGGA